MHKAADPVRFLTREKPHAGAQRTAAALDAAMNGGVRRSDAAPAGCAHDPRRAAAADGAGRAPVVGAGSAAVVLAICGEGAAEAVLASLQPTRFAPVRFSCAEIGCAH